MNDDRHLDNIFSPIPGFDYAYYGPQTNPPSQLISHDAMTCECNRYLFMLQNDSLTLESPVVTRTGLSVTRDWTLYDHWLTQPQIRLPVRIQLSTRYHTIYPLTGPLTLYLFLDEWVIRKMYHVPYACCTMWMQLRVGPLVIFSTEPCYHNNDWEANVWQG